MLGFSSQQELAASAQVNARDEGVNDKLRAWNQGGVYTVARVCCFRDNTLPYHRNDLALRAGYGNWRDELGLRWLDLDSRQARDYLAGLCGELAQLGFDEIVLECPALPCQGNLGAVVQSGSHAGSPQERAAEAEAFLAQVEQAVESAGTVVSLRVDRALLSEGGGVSGVTPDVLQKRPGRIWAAEDGQSPALAELLSQAGVTPLEERLVTLTPRLDGSLGAPQACFQEEGGG